MAKAFEYKFTGDARDFHRTLRSVDQGLADSEKRFKRFAGAFKMAGAAIAGAGVAAGIRDIAKAATDAQASEAKVRNLLENLGVNYEKHRKRIDDVVQAQARLTGFDDEELAESFANMARSTGSVNEALKLNALAADIARTKGTDLAGAQSLLARVYNGSFTGVKRLGIAIEPVTTAQDKLKASTTNATAAQVEAAKKADALATRQQALAQLQQKFGGQAEAYGNTTAGAYAKFQVALENVKERLGAALLPALQRVGTALATFLQQLESGTGAGGRVAAIFGDVAVVMRGVAEAFAGAYKFFRDNDAALVALTAVVAGATAGFIAFRTAAIAATVAQAAQTIATGGLTGAWVALNVAIRANPFVAVATVLAALGAALVVAYKKSETFRGIVTGAFDAVKKAAGALEDVFSSVFGGIKSVIRSVVGFIIDRIDAWLGMLQKVFEIAGKIPGVGDKFKGVARDIKAARADLQDFKDKLDSTNGKTINVSVRYKVIGAKRNDTKDDYPSGGAAFDAIDRLMVGGARGAAQSHARQNPFLPGPLGLGTRGASGVDAFTPIAGRHELAMTSAFRPGDPGWHGKNRARDYAGPADRMMRFGRYMASNFGSRLLELIYTPLGFGIKNGRRVPMSFFGSKVAADHFDHVHVAMRHGGKAEPTRATSPTVLFGEGKAPEYFIPTERQFRSRALSIWADAGKELGVVGFRKGGKKKGRLQGTAKPKGQDAEAILLAQLALAELTPGTVDDVKWLRELERLYQGWLALAKRRKDHAAIRENADALKGIRGRLGEFVPVAPAPADGPAGDSEAQDANTAALEKVADLLRQQNELQAQQIANANRALAVSQAQYGPFAQAIADWINGQIGGMTRASFAGASLPAGSTARY